RQADPDPAQRHRQRPPRCARRQGAAGRRQVQRPAGTGRRRLPAPPRPARQRRGRPADLGPALDEGIGRRGDAMPLDAYGMLAGRVVDQRAEGGTDTPHYQIHLRSGGADFRVAVNVLSRQHPSELLYLADEAFSHPVVQDLPALPDGFTPLPSNPGEEALDSTPANLFDRQLLRPVPATAPGPDNDLADKLDHYVQRAAADPAARLYAFGQRWGPESGVPDKVFGFSPGNGVHDIHMNQGNSGRFRGDDGVWQDGGVPPPFPAQAQGGAL